MKILNSIAASALYTIILLGVYWIHVTFVKVDVVFYAAIADVIIAVIIAGSVITFTSYFDALGRFEKIQLIVIWLFAGYALAISIPTVIDRSLSFYILEKIQQRGGGILQSHMEQVFVNEYVKEHRLVDVRLTEQLASGTIVIENGCVLLTEKGNILATFGRLFRTHFLPKRRLLMGAYSDDLTDPFRHTNIKINYSCSK